MESVIDLSPTMQRRRNFGHDLLDTANSHQCSIDEAKDRDAAILGHLWLVKDIVMRYRAHWPETRRFTDDMVSVGLTALTQYANDHFQKDWSQNQLQRSIICQISSFINNNRATISASRSTNIRRSMADEPLEYQFAGPLYSGQISDYDDGPLFVDLLDSIEHWPEPIKERIRDAILSMQQDSRHNLTEEQYMNIMNLAKEWRNLA